MKDYLKLYQGSVATHLPLLLFIASYAVLVVAGNVAFAIVGPSYAPLYPTDLFAFRETFSIGFWALLFAPFVLVPAAYTAARIALKRSTNRIAQAVPPVSARLYVVIALLLTFLALRSLIAADAYRLNADALDDLSSIKARFSILQGLRFWDLVVLQSLLPFLSFVALVSALRTGSIFWWLAAFATATSTGVGLLFLNAKWPLTVYAMGVAATFVSFANRKFFLLAIVVSFIGTFAAYFVVSTHVFRVSATRDLPASVADGSASAGASLAETSMRLAPHFIRHAIVRLAIGYPYYFHAYAVEGPVCGGLIEYMKIGAKCRPSTLIYTRIFPNDQFQGRGTAGSSAHITAYALGGWPFAIIAMFATAGVLAFFSCLPLDGNSTVGALRIVGSLAGYHFATIPGEGVFLYDHGLVWVFLLVAGMKVVSLLSAPRLR